MPSFLEMIEFVGLGFDAFGVLVIVVGAFIATGRLLLARPKVTVGYRQFRHTLGRSTLIGLELLVAADIVRTVAVSRTAEDLASLAVIVLIRTFLSIALEVELDGRWPWKQADGSRADDPELKERKPEPR